MRASLGTDLEDFLSIYTIGADSRDENIRFPCQSRQLDVVVNIGKFNSYEYRSLLAAA